MTESPQQPKEQALLKINRKFIREFSRIGRRFTSGESTIGYIMPFAILRNDEHPMDAYSIIDFKDMPAEALANLGLQKISAKTELNMDDIQNLIIMESEKIGFPTPWGGSGDFSETRIWRDDKAYELRFPSLEADYYGDTPEDPVYGVINGVASIPINSVDMLNRFVSGEFGCSFVSTPKTEPNGEEI